LYKSIDVLEVTKDEKTLLYNSFWNKACIVNKDWYEINIKEQSRKLNLSDINKDELRILLQNGIIYSCEDTYNKNSYEEKIKQRNTDLDIAVVYFHVTQRCNLQCSYCYNKKI